MKAILFFFISIHFLTAQDLKLTDIQGRWYVIQSNFPMWLSGKKTNPTFNYTIMERKGDTVLLDEVKYLKKGKNKTIVGYDKLWMIAIPDLSGEERGCSSLPKASGRLFI